MKKLFCFGHTFEGGDVIEGFQKNAGTELVVFPPEGDLEGGKSMVSSGKERKKGSDCIFFYYI